MPYPGVTIDVAGGNLLAEINVLDSVPALAATVSAEGGLVGKTQEVYSLADAEGKGYTQEDEPFVHGLLEEYYNELGGTQRLFVFGLSADMTMAQALAPATAKGVTQLLRDGGGDINLVAIARQPGEEYEAGAGFLDTDVEAAVTASKALCEAQQKANTPVRIFIEGRVANAAASNDYEPNTASNGHVAVVLGGTKADGSAAVSVALARACKYGAHVKLGNGQNGALSVQQVYIGTQRMEDRTDMETLHDAGFLTFMHRPGAAGYYFGRDNMCASDDFRILAHGRVIDKAQRVAAQAFAPFVEADIRMESDGTVNASDAAYIEETIDTALRRALSGQVSGLQVSVPLSQDVVNTSTLQVDVKVQPLGYLTWITVTLGLAATLG